MPFYHGSASIRRVATVVFASGLLAASVAPLGSGRAAEGGAPTHLVVSEVMTGGGGASDEFVELYNPSAELLPLEGLELVYVTASGATVTRKAAWELGAASVPPGGHVLVANELGLFAGIADVLYTGGLAAGGGSMALRIQGAATAIDAVGWGTAASSWLEGSPAPAPAAGSSIERLPGSSLGSVQDTDDNAADFVELALPDPQNSTSPPVPAPSASPSPGLTAEPTPTESPADGSPTPSTAPTATPEPAPTATPAAPPTALPSPTPVPTPSSSVTPTPTATPGASVQPSPTPGPILIAAARALVDDSPAAIRGVALTDSSFTDGGGYVADATGAIAVLLVDGSFERGERVTVAGVVDDRFAQRTLRADAGGLTIDGTGVDPPAVVITTGGVDESVEGRLVRASGAIVGAPTTLTGGLAFELDDGSGPVRVLVGSSTGILTAGWQRGAHVELVGVVGQRDSTGSGTSGYRIQPRATADIVAFTPPASPTPTPSATPPRSSTPRPSPLLAPSSTPRPAAPSASAETTVVSTIADARATDAGTRLRIRGVVTLGTGIVDPATAVIQDATGAIVLRTTDDAGSFSRGELVEVEGSRSTLSGMQTLRVSDAPTRLGSQGEPPPVVRTTGMIGEGDEALLVVMRGAISSAPRRSSAGNVSLTIDDGSGPASVAIFASTGIATERLVRDAWIEVTGVVGQETSSSEPQSGYRAWPRDAADVRLLASPTAAGAAGGGSGTAGTTSSGARRSAADTAVPDAASAGLAALLPGSSVEPGPDGVQGTLVSGRWPELTLAGILWDGTHAVGIADGEDAARQIEAVLSRGGPPAPVRIAASAPSEPLDDPELPVVEIPADRAVERVSGAAAEPLGELPAEPGAAWVRLTGRVALNAASLSLETADGPVQLDRRCERPDAATEPRAGELVVAEGLADGRTARLVVGCTSIRPAPVLSAVPGEPTAATERVDGRAVQAAPSPADEAVPPAMLLLGSALSASGIAGAMAWRRGRLSAIVARLRGEEPVPDPSTNAPEIEQDVDLAEEPTRRLEVVRLPGERGQPPGV